MLIGASSVGALLSHPDHRIWGQVAEKLTNDVDV